MSIVRMRKVFRGRKRVKIGKKYFNILSPAEIIFGLIIVIFVVGAYYTFGGPAGGSDPSRQQGRVTGVVATVNGEKISRAVYEANLNMRQQYGGESDPTQERWTKVGLLDALTDSILKQQAVKRERIKVSSADINKKIEEKAAQQLAMRFPDEKAQFRYLKKQGLTPEQLQKQVRDEVAQDREGLKQEVAEEKLREMVESKVALSDEELKDSYTEVQASHILIKPEEAKPADAKAPQQAADPDAAAKKKAEELLTKIKQGADFAKLAKENSDDPGSAQKGGDLGFFKRENMVDEFAEAAFKLQPGQVSDLVKSKFGYHIIKVTGRKAEVPKDFDKNKETYREQALSERKYRAWQEYQAELKEQARIEIADPELQAYKLLDEAMRGGAPDLNKLIEGKAKLEEAVNGNPQNVTALWELASLYEQEGNKQRAAELLEQATLTPEGAGSPAVHLRLGGLFEELKKTSEAVAQYKEAYDRASAFTQGNFFANMQVEQKLKSLGQKDLVKQVTQWLDDYRAEQAKNPSGGQGGFNPMGGGMPFTIPQ